VFKIGTRLRILGQLSEDSERTGRTVQVIWKRRDT